MTDDSFDLELAATTLLADARDMHALLKVLVSDLSNTLGDRLRVERKGGLLRRSDEIKSVQIRLANEEFEAHARDGAIACAIGHSSGGIRIRTEKVDMAAWLRRLLFRLQDEASRSQEARPALERLIIGGP